jgi:hypothetical protein
MPKNLPGHCNLIGDQVDSGLADWPFEVALLNGKPPKFCWPAHNKVVSNLKFENMLRNQGKVTLSVRLPACVRGGPRICRERERAIVYLHTSHPSVRGECRIQE